MPVMARLTPTCETVSHKVSESFDHPLSLYDRIRVRLHLLGCELCSRYEKQLQQIHRMIMQNIDEINKENTSQKLSEEARQRIKKKVKEN